MAFFLVVDVAAFVRASIWPSKDTSPVNQVVLPLANKFAAIRPLESALAVNPILTELAIVAASILPLEFAYAVFQSLFVVTRVDRPILPLPSTFSMTHVIDPISHILTISIGIEIGTFARLFVALPISNIHSAISMDNSPKTLPRIIDEIAIVTCTIWPNLRSTSMPDFSCHISRIFDLHLQNLVLLSLHSQA
jgi:hypothetical protein